jgi:hypothetical protein
MEHDTEIGSSGVPLLPEDMNSRVALASVILEIHILTKKAIPKEISQEIRLFRGNPGMLEQKVIALGAKYATIIDELLKSFIKVIGKRYPDLKVKIERLHLGFSHSFDEEIHIMADQIHRSPTFEKAQVAGVNYLEGHFKVNIEKAFQTLADSVEELVNRVLR